MRFDILSSLVVSATGASALANGHSNENYKLRPFTLNLDSRVPRMLELIRHTQLPDAPEYPGLSPDAGIPLSTLKSLRTEWLTDFSWEKEQAAINRLINSVCHTEQRKSNLDLDIPSLLQKSKA